MLNDDKFCAFNADIINSKKMNEEQRYDAQIKIENIVEEFNLKNETTLAAKIDFSAGDQLQALFYNACEAYEFSCDFREKLFPIQFRFGLGIGNWSVRFPGESTNKQDGTAYHYARNALDYIHQRNKNIAFYSDSDIDAYINILVAQEYAIFNSQTDKQKLMFKIYKDLYPINPAIMKINNLATIYIDKGSQKVVSEKLVTSRQSVNKLLRSGSVYDQRDLQGAIILILSNVFNTEEEDKSR